jgi:hypothetical protein
MNERKKFNFVKVSASYLKKEDTYWALHIVNLKELMSYLDIQSPKLVEAYFQLKKKRYSGEHLVGEFEQAVAATFIYDEVENPDNVKRKTFVYDILKLSDSFCQNKIRDVVEGKQLLVNPTGMGFCHYDKEQHIFLASISSNSFIYPENNMNISVKQWEGRTHWYVRIGGHDLEKKFNTYASGLRAGEHYLEEELAKRKETK